MAIRILVASDVRLLQLFHRHSGTELLSAMSGYTDGLLRQEVTDTLKHVTKGNNIPHMVVIICSEFEFSGANTYTMLPHFIISVEYGIRVKNFNQWI